MLHLAQSELTDLADANQLLSPTRQEAVTFVLLCSQFIALPLLFNGFQPMDFTITYSLTECTWLDMPWRRYARKDGFASLLQFVANAYSHGRARQCGTFRRTPKILKTHQLNTDLYSDRTVDSFAIAGVGSQPGRRHGGIAIVDEPSTPASKSAPSTCC